MSSMTHYEPLYRTSLPPDLIRALGTQGILVTNQIWERWDKLKDLAGRIGWDFEELRRSVRRALGEAPEGLCGGPLMVLPPCGLVPAQAGAADFETMEERFDLAGLAAKLEKNLPPMVDLTARLPGVRDQQNHGFCVGFGSANTREYPLPGPVSPGFIYRGCKSIDGIDAEGTRTKFAFEFMYKVGSVPEAAYTYDEAVADRPIEPLFRKAGKQRIDAFVELTSETDDCRRLPTLLKAALSGLLIPELGGQPVTVSLAVHQSVWGQRSAHDTGLLTLPLPGEKPCGGHCMCCVGYFAASANPYGVDLFLVRNSYGLDWAHNSPMGYPGHALVPAAYFQDPALVWSAILAIAERSPLKGPVASLWRKTRAAM